LRLQIVLTPKSDDLIVVGSIERVEAAQDVGRLPERESEVGPINGYVAEPHDRPTRGVLRSYPGGVGLDPWQRDARLNATLHVE
jgi:hypothetical protein